MPAGRALTQRPTAHFHPNLKFPSECGMCRLSGLQKEQRRLGGVKMEYTHIYLAMWVYSF